MNVKLRRLELVIFAALSAASLFAAGESQNFTINKGLQIPGAMLKPGAYTLAIEDRMRDRAIVRISNTGGKQSFLLLAAPNSTLTANTNEIIYFDSAKQILRGWECAGCTAALEFVYPKAEAARIVGDTGQSALAVDPVSDKLPPNLSADDMKVVTLWLLSPKRLEAGNRGAGLNAVKYSPKGSAETASASSGPLPETASNLYLVALCGCLSLSLALCLQIAPLIRRRLCTR